ncbi:MAG: class I SAM-dependent methyltransferase [Candidatus Lokiarchaeota archaeon]|nr:class I SAM-dependent methyltransferase [Candidatus Lokiarchaeota archaeon]
MEIPNKYRNFSSFGPYFIPLFGRMYFGRIKNIIKTVTGFNRNFPKVLDIGGGLGLFSVNFKLNFPMSSVVILDKSLYEGIKETLTKYPTLKVTDYVKEDIQNKTSFEKESLDLIFALDILEHVENPSIAIDEILRILKKDGLLFISVPTESILLKIVRKIIGTIKNIQVNPHWLGRVRSEKEFFNILKSKNIKIVFKRRYPYNLLPRLFSYDIFYLIQKSGVKKT